MIDLLLDVDAGVDDTIAILFALAHPGARVRGITTVAGNVGVDDVTENVRVVVAAAARAGRAAPAIARGAEAPVARPLTTAPEVHGPEGLGGVRARLAQAPLPPLAADDAVAFLARELRRGPSPVLVTTGPLTNVAHLIRHDPGALAAARGLVCMLGSFGAFGNTEVVSEFNAFVDPEAAAEVLASGVMPLLVPLDVTERCFWPRAEAESASGPFGRFIAQVAAFYFDYHVREEATDGGFLHDPLAVAAAIEPDLVRAVPAHVRVECHGTFTSGKTIAELRPGRRSLGPPNARVALDLDVERFRRTFETVLGFRAPAR